MDQRHRMGMDWRIKMAVEVEILSSNVEVLAKQPPLELLPFLDFLEITQYMEIDETVTFQLLEVNGDPFYRGTFTKLSEEWTLERDMQKKLNQLIKQKKMTAEQAENLFYKLSFKRKPRLNLAKKRK